MDKGAENKKVGIVPDLFVVERRAKVESFVSDELIIALCGPIGSPLHKVAEALKSALKKDFGYSEGEIIKLSDFIRQHGEVVKDESLEQASEAFRTRKSLIEKGNKLREKYSNSVLSDLAIHKIASSRKSGGEVLPRRHFHIIDSIKNKDELDALNSIYGDMLYFVGVFSPLNVREKSLLNSGMTSAEVHQLIDQDSGEEIDNGQSVRDTFPCADYFIRIEADTDSQIKGKVERFINLILGTKILTPTSAETAMYQASSASGNSACLSRQVGAAITDEIGNVLSIGWNDVPKSGGGLFSYSNSDPAGDQDRRCWNISGGTCFNDSEKDLFANLLVGELIKEGLISRDHEEIASNRVRSNKKLGGLIEFSRSIHAEMHAILNAGQASGARMIGGKIFVTTYPCHSCARHIIAAGITEIYYIEPYRKSLAIKLHDDSITEHDSGDGKKVKILMYEGTAPSRYIGFFRAPPDSRKRNGKMIVIDPVSAKPRYARTLEAIPVLESLKVTTLKDKKLIPSE